MLNEISLVDLTSAILHVRSYFAKRGIVVRLARRKTAQHNFTTGQVFPIVVRGGEVETGHACVLERKRLSGGSPADGAKPLRTPS